MLCFQGVIRLKALTGKGRSPGVGLLCKTRAYSRLSVDADYLIVWLAGLVGHCIVHAAAQEIAETGGDVAEHLGKTGWNRNQPCRDNGGGDDQCAAVFDNALPPTGASRMSSCQRTPGSG
jgi:hypothetical protein